MTLVEVMVALAIGASVLLSARLLLDGVTLGGERVAKSRRASDRRVLPERTLRTLLLRVEVGTDSSLTFEGGEHTARFTSWCDVPGGWQERCLVGLAVVADTAGNELRVATSTGTSEIVRTRFAAGEIRYLGSAEAGGTWLVRWGRSLTTPEAILIVTDTDSLILRVGVRG